MSLLWKKSKITQLSGLVSDLRSRRNQSSLLVQTGFPTSLADLVVKNHPSLKKKSSSKNKRKKKKIARDGCPPAADFSSSSSPPPRPVMSSSSESPALELPSEDRSRCEAGEEFCQSDLSCSSSEEFKDGVVRVSNSRSFSVIVKLFFMVVLALGSKGIAVGITASALLLFFLEFIGKRLSFCSRDSAFGLDLKQVDAIRVKESDLGSSDSKRSLPADLANAEKTRKHEVWGIEEIQVVEPDLDLFRGKGGLESTENKWKSEILAVGDEGDLIKAKKGRNRKLGTAVFKKFWKKLAPNKFRGSKNGKVSGKEELNSSGEASELKGGVAEEIEEEDAQEAEDEENCISVSTTSTSLANSKDVGLTRKNARKEIEWNLGLLVSFVIALFGLAGGRLMALLLTIAWFLLVKSVEAGWRNLKKLCDSGTLL